MFQRARRGISYLPQEPSVFRKLTVEDNLMAILETLPLSGHERRERMNRLIEQLGLDRVRESKGYMLSGGERRRVEIARSLVIEPDFLLLDEPFSGIDPIQVLELQRIIFDLKRAGIGILITDHKSARHWRSPIARTSSITAPSSAQAARKPSAATPKSSACISASRSACRWPELCRPSPRWPIPLIFNGHSWFPCNRGLQSAYASHIANRVPLRAGGIRPVRHRVRARNRDRPQRCHRRRRQGHSRERPNGRQTKLDYRFGRQLLLPQPAHR